MRALLWPLPLVLAGGCSFLFEPTGGRDRDGGVADASSSDRPDARSAADASVCPDKIPDLFSGINTSMDEDDPAVTEDGLTLFFARATQRGEPADIYLATRPSRCERWGLPEAIVHDDFGGIDQNNPTLGPNGLLYYRKTEDAVSTIQALEWKNAAAVPSEQDEHYEALADECMIGFEISDLFVVNQTVFYASTLSCSDEDQRRLYRVEVENGPTGFWAEKNQPWVSADEDRIYAANFPEQSICLGVDCAGGCELGAEVAGISEAAPEDPWLTQDGWLYYAGRVEAPGPRDLYAIEAEP